MKSATCPSLSPVYWSNICFVSLRTFGFDIDLDLYWTNGHTLTSINWHQVGRESQFQIMIPSMIMWLDHNGKIFFKTSAREIEQIVSSSNFSYIWSKSLCIINKETMLRYVQVWSVCDIFMKLLYRLERNSCEISGFCRQLIFLVCFIKFGAWFGRWGSEEFVWWDNMLGRPLIRN